ncbi:MAG TPA: hypothetical protein VEB22_11135 [Phycisphaerales bacterium]|nr:hypothetical protein [Phycisphaerales bacterium]
MSAAPTNPGPAATPKPGLPPAAFTAIALIAIVGTLVMLAAIYIPIVTLAASPPPPAVEPLSGAKVDARKREFGDRIASAADKVVKRSPFHPPVVPPDPIPEVPPTYGGPSIVGVAGGAVYFNDSMGSTKRIGLGEIVDGVEVIKIDAPWSVTLGWKGGKYDVPMLDRKPVSFDQSPMIKDTLFKTTPAGASSPRNN